MTFFKRLLDLPLVRRTRRNHGLEHATIHLLSQRVRGLRIAGRSSHNGFVLIGEVDTGYVQQAVADALQRMRGGQTSLAIHPNCGTNLGVTGYLTSLVALVGLQGANDRDRAFNRLPFLMMAMMVTVVLSQPLGTWLQRHVTTSGDPADTEVLSVTRREWGGMVFHNVRTRSS